MPKKAILVVAGGLIVTIALTIALDALFTRSTGHDWATAVQASATLVLVAVTGVYVWITYRQMQLQATPLVAIRLAAQEQTARQVVGVLERMKDNARALIRDMPRADSRGEPNTDILHADEAALAEVVIEVSALAPGLPTALALETIQLPHNFITAGIEVFLFSRACSLEGTAAASAHRDWTWDGARRSYLAEVRDPERHHPEWDDLVRLTTLHRAVEELTKVEVDIAAYLLSPAQGIRR